MRWLLMFHQDFHCLLSLFFFSNNQTRNVSMGTQMPPLLQNLHILMNKSKKDIFMNKGQSLWKPQDYMDHFET